MFIPNVDYNAYYDSQIENLNVPITVIRSDEFETRRFLHCLLGLSLQTLQFDTWVLSYW